MSKVVADDARSWLVLIYWLPINRAVKRSPSPLTLSTMDNVKVAANGGRAKTRSAASEALVAPFRPRRELLHRLADGLDYLWSRLLDLCSTAPRI